MEKTVTGIDLDEIRKAREEMMVDAGITPPPQPTTDYSQKAQEYDAANIQQETVTQVENSETSSENIDNNIAQTNEDDEFDMSDEEFLAMIEDFISDAEEETEEFSKTNEQINETAKAQNESELLNNNDNEINTDDMITNGESIILADNSQNINLDHYDAFSQFEINTTDEIKSLDIKPLDMSTIENVDIKPQTAVEPVSNQQTESPITEKESEEAAMLLYDINRKMAEFDVKDDEEDDIEEEIEEEIASAEKTDLDVDKFVNEVLEEIEKEQLKYEEQEKERIRLQEEQEKELEEVLLRAKQEEKELEKTVKIEEETNLKEDVVETEKVETIEAEESVKSEEIKTVEPVEEKIVEVENSTIKDSVLSEEEEQLFKEFLARKRAEKRKIEETKVVEPIKKEELLPSIDGINFVNILSMQDFKNSDNFTFALGKNENGDIIYENLRQSYNIAFFANKNSYELLNSILLSFMLKNNSNEFKLALCDGNHGNTFNYYLNSKYLYENSIASNEDEIASKLANIANELEERYHILARFNVKSVDEYNIIAKNSGVSKLSQILIVIDGYYELMHSSNFERIKSLLYQILRLGRIAGIYAMIVTDKKIDEDIINFNLPSRIGFKCNEIDDSIAMIGETGIDKLSSEHEFLYSSLNYDNARRIRQPIISDSIIKILIDNIER